MELQPNKVYTLVKKIKIHTKPLREVCVQETGLFLRETNSSLIFRGFSARKQNVVRIEEVKESVYE